MTATEGKTVTEGKNPLAPPANGLQVASQAWETEARFVGFQEPKSWAVEGRSGVTYRVDLRIAEGTVFVKVPEQLYQEMQAAGLQFGDRLVLFWGKNSVKGELRVDPVAWRKL